MGPFRSIQTSRWVGGGRPLYYPTVAELDALVQIPGLSAELDIVVGKAVRQAMAGPMSREQRMQLWRSLGAPVIKRVDMAGTVTAAQAGLSTAAAYFAWPARPQTGRLWSVRKIQLQAGSPPVNNGPFTASIANLTAAIFVTSAGLTGEAGLQPSPQDCDQTGFTLPNTQFYSTHQLWVRGGEFLAVGIEGTAVVTGFQVFGQARVVEIDDSPELLMTL